MWPIFSPEPYLTLLTSAVHDLDSRQILANTQVDMHL